MAIDPVSLQEVLVGLGTGGVAVGMSLKWVQAVVASKGELKDAWFSEKAELLKQYETKITETVAQYETRIDAIQEERLSDREEWARILQREAERRERDQERLVEGYKLLAGAVSDLARIDAGKGRNGFGSSGPPKDQE